MKLKLLPLALLAAAAAGPAAYAADATTTNSVKVYGTADVTIESVSSTGETVGPDVSNRTRVSTNSSALGFAGERAVGNGSAFFQLEYGVAYDGQGNGTGQGTGPGSLISVRDTFVGYRNAMGEIKAGVLTLPIRSISGKFNYNPGSTSISDDIPLMVNVNNVNPGFHSRAANSIQYTSPVLLGGLTAIVGYGTNEGLVDGNVSTINTTTGAVTSAPATGVKNPTVSAFGLYWEPADSFVNVYYAHELRTDMGSVSSISPVSAFNPNGNYGTDDRLIFRFDLHQGTRFLIGYDTITLNATYGTVPVAGTISRTALALGVSQMVGKHEFIATYTKANAIDCSATAVPTGTTAATGCGLASQTGATQWAFNYHYWWDKSTMFQAFATAINNDRNASYDFDVNPTVNTAFTAGTQQGARPVGIGFGIRYSF